MSNWLVGTREELNLLIVLAHANDTPYTLRFATLRRECIKEMGRMDR